MKKFLYTIGALLLLTACTEDYTDWADPQSVSQPETVAFGNGSITPLSSVIDFAELAEDAQIVQVCNITAPTASDASYAPFYIIRMGDQSFNLQSDGFMQLSDLQAYVENTFGKAPQERQITAVVDMWLDNGPTTVKTASSDEFIIKVKPDAPFIDPNGYYLVGNIDSWSCTRVDAYHMVNNGGDVYANPEFSVTIPAVSDITTYEVKMVPASAFNEDGTIGNWDIALSALPDVDETSNTGRFSYSNAGGNIKFAAEPGALYYKISANLMEGTYAVEPLSFATFIYEIGNSHSWSTSMPLYCANSDGKYQGYYYLDGGFKFKPNADNWDGDWGQDPNGADGTLVQDGEKDCSATAGFYQIDVDLVAMTYALTAVNSISIIGTVNGNWDTDTDLTYNTATGAWETVATLNAGAMKFRMNHDWAISWGGANDDPTAYGNLTQNNGKDLNLDEAGTYKVELYIAYEGNNKVVLTKQ